MMAELTATRQSTLEQYILVTNQEPSQAVPVLQRAEWNLQIAISRFFDGEPQTDALQEAIQETQRDARVQETLLESLHTPSSSRSRLPAAPRIVPPPNPEVNYKPGFPFNILLAPFSLASFVLSRLFRTIAPFVPFLPQLVNRLNAASSVRATHRRALKPQDTAARFIREFEEEYGTKDLPFREMGYAHTLDAAKRELKYLLVVIFSPEHDDMAAYVHDTLLAPEVLSFLRDKDNNVMLWGGSVRDAEAYQIAEAFRVTKFPYAALIANSPTSRSTSGGASTSSSGMSIIAPLSGLLPPAEFLTKIRRAIASHAPEISRLQAEQAERNASRSIREQQDSAYEQSLARDRERARQKKEEEAKKKQEEEKARKLEQERESIERNTQSWKSWRAARILPEPAADDTSAVRLSIRLADGERIVRRLPCSASIEEVYAIVECYDLIQQDQISKESSKPASYEHKYHFQLVSPMPRTVYEASKTGNIRAAIGRSANLIVEQLDAEDE